MAGIVAFLWDPLGFLTPRPAYSPGLWTVDQKRGVSSYRLSKQRKASLPWGRMEEGQLCRPYFSFQTCHFSGVGDGEKRAEWMRVERGREYSTMDTPSKCRKSQRRGFVISATSVPSVLSMFLTSLLFSLYNNSHAWSLFTGSENSCHHQPISICNPALDHTCFHSLLLLPFPSCLLSFLFSSLISFFCFQSTFTLIWSWQQPQERKNSGWNYPHFIG